MPLPQGPGSPNRQQSINTYTMLLTQQYGSALGGDYRRYMAAHPQADPQAIYDTVVQRLQALVAINQALPKTIGSLIQGAGLRTGQAGAGIAAGAAQIGQDFSLGIDWGSLVLRFGEILIGLVLVGVGLSKLTGAQNIIATVAKEGVKFK